MSNFSKQNILTVILCVASAAALVASTSYAQDATPPKGPHTWVEAGTGHKVIQLTYEPGSKGLYFNENAFTPDGKEMLYLVAGNVKAIELATYKVHLVVQGPISAMQWPTNSQ